MLRQEVPVDGRLDGEEAEAEVEEVAHQLGVAVVDVPLIRTLAIHEHPLGMLHLEHRIPMPARRRRHGTLPREHRIPMLRMVEGPLLGSPARELRIRMQMAVRRQQGILIRELGRVHGVVPHQAGVLGALEVVHLMDGVVRRLDDQTGHQMFG